MANPEHLAILEKGVDAWNKWREENPDIRPDLSGLAIPNTDYHGINLSKSILRAANFYGINLYGSNLNNAFLGMIRLGGANLCYANLLRADLCIADLRGTNFSNANLSEANCSGCHFDGAIVRGTNFHKAIFKYTILANIDFNLNNSIQDVVHEGPSTIGLDTFYRSQGNIPEAFLRGCGVPDQMIEYARSLTATPFQYYSCFISYSHSDEEFAKRLWEGLQANNVRCWLASEDMKIGDKIRPTIDESIQIHDKLLLILSEHSVQSDWVEHEVEHALDRERIEKKNILFPVRLDQAVMDRNTGWAGNVKRLRHIGDFSRWKEHDAYKKSFDRLLRDLKAGK
jgi:uncharacterized protein YjbI with pentapeptide repeats